MRTTACRTSSNELIANRPVIAAEINARREEGDLRENGGYHAARDEQGKQEARIVHLQALLRSAKVGQAPASDGAAGPGMVVEVRYEGDDETETFLIGSREELHTAGVNVFSPVSPVGKALTGKRPGEVAEYATPGRQDDAGDPGQRDALRRLTQPRRRALSR